MSSDVLKANRKRLNRNQAEMAALLDVSRQSYISWEKGHHKIPPEKLALALAMEAPQSVQAPYQMDSASRYARDVEGYHRLRAEWGYPNHATVMEYKRMEGNFWAPEAFKAIAQRYPDILTAPGEIDWNALMPTIDYLWRNPRFGGFRGPLFEAHRAKYEGRAGGGYPDGFMIVDNQLVLLTEKKGN